MPTTKQEMILGQIALSVLMPPTMIMLILGEKTLQLLLDLSESTEEIFRGERLPILKQHELPDD
jgi:hypothetical protein